MKKNFLNEMYISLEFISILKSRIPSKIDISNLEAPSDYQFFLNSLSPEDSKTVALLAIDVLKEILVEKDKERG